MHLHTVALGGKPGTVYLGTHFGIFTSTDGGRSWPQQRGALNTLMVTMIAVHPRDANALALVGTPSVSKADPAGIYFSEDGGANWKLRAPSNLPGGAYPFSVRAGSAGVGHYYAYYLYAGWFETKDSGRQWQELARGQSGELPEMQAPVLLTFPDAPEHLLLGGDQGLYESRDDGQHWMKIDAVQGSVSNLALAGTAPATLLCVTDHGLYRWQDTQHIPQVTQLNFPQQKMFSQLTVDKSGKNVYGFAGRTLWYSSDGGASWSARQQFERGDMIALLVDPQHAETLYAGFFLPPRTLASSDGGKSWRTIAD
jgi:photosystem II stability/assembly factor-like uncharacterized protein